ncbi:MAG: OTU domain-containing protein, partial [Gammaproteobacteria bacterium]
MEIGSLIESANKITIEAYELQNAGMIKAYGEFKLKVLDCLENLQSGRINASQDLMIEACNIVKNSGLIFSGAKALIKLGNILKNYSTGIIRAKEFELLGGWRIENFGRLLGIDKLQLNFSGIINNYQSGNISCEHALELIGNSIYNRGNIIATDLKLTLQHILQNYCSGKLIAIEALNLIGAKLVVNAGKMSSLKHLDIKTIEVLENMQGGNITAREKLTAIADLFIANYGQLTAGDLFVKASKLLELNGQVCSNRFTGSAQTIVINKGSTNVANKVSGFNYIPIPKDGHGLYNAVAIYLGKNIMELWQEVADYIEKHAEEYSDIIAADPKHRTIEKYIDDIRNTNEWADDLEINVLMKVFDRPIYVIGSDGEIKNKLNIVDVNKEPIFVYYNGSDHYDGLILVVEHSGQQILENLLGKTYKAAAAENGIDPINETSKRNSDLANTDGREQAIDLEKDHIEIDHDIKNIEQQANDYFHSKVISDYVNQPVVPDGSCFYRAVNLYMYGQEGMDDSHIQTLRDMTAKQLEQLESSKPFYESSYHDKHGLDFKQYIQDVTTNFHRWAGNFEISALMMALKRPIYLVEGNFEGNEIRITNCSQVKDLLKKSDLKLNMNEPIFVHYNGINHYNAYMSNFPVALTDTFTPSYINSGATSFTADLMQIDGKLNTTSLSTHAKKLHLLENSEITCSENSKLLSYEEVIILGKILSNKQLSIVAKELFQGVNATIDVNHSLYLKVFNLYLEGTLKVDKDLLAIVENQLVNFGKILVNDKLAMVAKEILHDKAAKIDVRDDFYLKAIDLRLHGKLEAGKNLFILAENQFEYTTAILSANGELHLTLADGSQIKYDINTIGDLKIEFLTKNGTWYNEQQLKAGGNLTLDIPGFIFVNGKSSKKALLQANNVLKIDAAQVDTGLGTLKATDLGIHTQSDITVNKNSKIEVASGIFHSEEGGIEQQAELTAIKGITLLASEKYGQAERAALNTSMIPQYKVTSNYDPIIYKLASSNKPPKYFKAIAVSGADGACALAAIYKIVGSKEVGWQARIKAVQQLKEHIDDPVVRDLIRSELRGALLSDQDLYELESIGLPISSDELLAIGYFKATRLMLIEEGERLKIKYFSDRDLPIDGTNKSYAKLFLDGDLDKHCEITEAEKAKLQALAERVNDVNLAIEQLVDDQILNYVDHVVGKSGFWLGVAGNSLGVMGAIAKINKVHFKILTDHGSQDASSNSPEVISIYEQISVPDAQVHNIYLRSTVGDVPGVQKNSSHFELLKETSDPALHYSISEAKKAKSKINISGKIKAGNVAVIADGKVTGISQIEADVDALIGSLCDDVEIKSIRARRGNNENFDDYIISQARIVAKNMLQISAGGNIVFHGVETESGEGGTYLRALADVLDVPIDLVSQRIQHFYEKKKSGTIRDTYYKQHTSTHKSKKDFSSYAGGSSVFYSHSVDAQTGTIASVGKTSVLDTTSSHEHAEDLRGKKRRWWGGSKRTSSYHTSVSSKSVGTIFKIAKELRISGADVALRHIHSTAARNIFSAPGGRVSILQGENRFGSVRVKSSSDALWKKSSSESIQLTTYSESTFTGTIEIESQAAVIEVVSGRVLSFLKQITTKPEDFTYKTLIEHYERHAESLEGPGPGVVAIVAVVTAIATQGAAAGWASSLLSGATEGVAHAALTAGFQGLFAQAASSMVANNGDFSKALKELASTDTVKKLAITMLSAGIMDKIGSTLKLPTDAKLRSMPQRVTNHIAKANVGAALDVGICHKKAEVAWKDSFINAAFAIVCSKVDAMHELAGLSNITSGEHTMLHAMLGGVRGTAIRGQRGWLCGMIDDVISAKLPPYIEKLKAQKPQLKQQDKKVTGEQEKLAKQQYDRNKHRRAINAAWLDQAGLFNEVLQFSEQTASTAENTSTEDRQSSQVTRQQPSVAMRAADSVLDFFVPAVYADEPTSENSASSSCTKQQEGTWSVIKKAISGDPSAKLEMRCRAPGWAAASDEANSKANKSRGEGAIQCITG